MQNNTQTQANNTSTQKEQNKSLEQREQELEQRLNKTTQKIMGAITALVSYAISYIFCFHIPYLVSCIYILHY
ncbi:hypothetical protein LS77_007540 [Helicobacter bilis]|uniref:Uncharacterized protein n=2 Tax=Helicobacter bilis TaxID=37372 RepID=A0A6D2C8K9_9HELI|nr:hypothetical protein [Helicobacter bilis]EMZ37207.1 hypothetical protein C826_02204 [Helicobacter bilis WiWa]TLE03998.1 hypothetical protein LS77_007540 [Helicobacter bilis]TLE04723.1 hypothetical protein LS76_007580 [Helicobacter bilis]